MFHPGKRKLIHTWHRQECRNHHQNERIWFNARVTGVWRLRTQAAYGGVTSPAKIWPLILSKCIPNKVRKDERARFVAVLEIPSVVCAEIISNEDAARN
jgi:hypothetical protein